MEKDRKAAVLLQMYDNPDLFFAINKYRVSLGWTWKRMFLVGFADIIGKNGDNPDLVLAIADYLEKKR